MAGGAAHGQELGHHPAGSVRFVVEESGVGSATSVRSDDQLRERRCSPPVLGRRAGHVAIVTFLPLITYTPHSEQLAHSIPAGPGRGRVCAVAAHDVARGGPRKAIGADPTAIRTSSNCTSFVLVVPPGPSTRSRTEVGTWPVDVMDAWGTPSTRTSAT